MERTEVLAVVAVAQPSCYNAPEVLMKCCWWPVAVVVLVVVVRKMPQATVAVWILRILVVAVPEMAAAAAAASKTMETAEEAPTLEEVKRVLEQAADQAAQQPVLNRVGMALEGVGLQAVMAVPQLAAAEEEGIKEAMVGSVATVVSAALLISPPALVYLKLRPRLASEEVVEILVG